MAKQPSSPPTLADVGRIAGYCASTVSMALRDDPRIPEITKEKVRKAAQKLQYVPDPMLAALVARRSNSRRSRTLANIATLIDDRWPPNETNSWIVHHFAGMEKACQQLGYHLDRINIQRDLQTHPHPDKLLASRGIRGLVILPVFDHNIVVPLDWNRYASITIGTPLDHVRTHHTSADLYSAMTLACEKVRELGYRRVGLAHWRLYEERNRYEWLGSLCKESYSHEGFTVVPPYLSDEETSNACEVERWFLKHRPDCILTSSGWILRHLTSVGIKVPQDVGIVTLSRNLSYTRHYSGIIQHLDTTAEAAVKHVHQMILHGETGLPEHPSEIKIYPDWHEGDTTRRLKPA
ncbi:MAG: hypothetical protein B9S32_05270 [Verrucomicrobia bacterium Tous-C9LFEB]|nr:MAG: hypothetical protein B9S32_05270 [Verrucomicrobia bacterium Tous-C9LFEB]